MRIAQLSPLWKTVPPKRYGGSELIVSLLTEELVKLNHEVTLFACRGSKTRGNMCKVIPKPLYDILGQFKFDAVQFQDFLAIKKVFDLARKGEIDIIHNHMGFHVSILSDVSPVPMVSTIHSSLPPDNEEVARAAKSSVYVSISNTQRKLAPYLNYVGTVYHGIDTRKFSFNKKPGDYLLFFATMWKEKGVDRAIKIAKESNMRLIMAGDIRRQSDFDEISKYIDGKNIIYLEEVDFAQKNQLMANAKAYLFPIRWNEAFGLTVVESLACGTPVIAYKNGSLPEIIKNKETGFLVNSIEEAVKAVTKIGEISREKCRQIAKEKFDVSVMTKNYLKIYEDLQK